MDKSSDDLSWRYFIGVVAIILALVGLDKAYQYHHIVCQNSYSQNGQVINNCDRGTGQRVSSNETVAARCEVTLCMDSSCSFSSGSGTCSHHGGEWVIHHND